MRTLHRYLALAALAAAAAPAAKAQQKTIIAGPSLGLNVAKVVGDNQDDASSRSGYRIGAFATIELSRNLSFQPELIYTGKGTKWVDDDADIKIGYIQIPLLARLRFPSASSRFIPYVMAGPAVAIKAGCTLTVEGDKHPCNDETTAVAGSDFGAVFGAGAELGAAQVSLRIDAGLKNINGDGPANVKNRAITMAVGYGFRVR